MLEYNRQKNILYAYQNKLARPNLDVEDDNNVVFRSFRNYKEQQCKDDVMNIFMPALRDAIKVQSDLLNTNPERITIKQVSPGVFKDMTHHVMVRFEVQGFDNDTAQGVTVMKLPNVSPNGTIEWKGKEYSFIHMLEQEPTVSYEANESTRKAATLKIKNDTRAIWIDDDARKIKIRLSDRAGKSSKTTYTLINLIAAMADEEGYDIYKVWDEFANFAITNMFKDEDDKILHLDLFGGNQGPVNAIDYSNELVPRLNLTRLKYNGTGDMSYDNTKIRNTLNELLALDRAVGETLAKDVYSQVNPGRLLVTAGTTIDENMISTFNSEGVYKVYVQYTPNVEGYYLAQQVLINSARKGLKLTENIRAHFPDEHGMYLSKDYDRIPYPIVYNEGETLTEEVINNISAFGMDYVYVSDKKTGGFVKKLNFYEEIISNRQFEGSYIGRTPGEWYYLNKDNMFVQNNGTYTTYDFVALQSFCVKLFEGKWIGRVVNADAGFRKQLVTLSEQYHRAFVYATREAMKQMNRKFKTIWQNNRSHYLIADQIDNEFFPFEKAFWKYLRDEAKCLVALQSDNVHNPIAYQSARTKINVYTANKHSVADSQREIAIGSYGKIDPYEIPQSQKMGTVYNSTCDVEITDDGIMKTKYYPVRSITNGVYKVDINNPVYLTSIEEESSVIADVCSLVINDKGIIQNSDDNVLCRVPAIGTMEKQTFANRPVSEITHVNCTANQPLSWSSSTIPFMGSNDAARAIFAVAQEKSVKGLVEPEEPDVITSAYEQYVWLNDKFGIIAKKDGVIQDVFYDYSTEKYTINVVYDGQDGIDDGTIYEFNEYFNSGSSVTKMKVLVKKGDIVKRGQMIVSSNFISENGILQFGRNALVAYICDGYNYEDGSHLSQKMCDKLASYRINKEEFSGNPKSTSNYRLASVPNGKWISVKGTDSVDVKYVDSRFSGMEKRTIPIKKAYGFYESCDPLKAEHGRNNYGVVINTISVDKFSQGDKASNRHGNKGVLTKSEPTANMPRLRNGMPIDITLNPLGVGSRMNIGQIKEAHCGLFAHVLGIKLSADAYNGISDNEIELLMSFTVDLMNSTGDPTSIAMSYSDVLPDGLIQYAIGNIKNIRRYANCFNKKGTTTVMLPDNNGKYTETEVLIGYIYMFKLIQEAHTKLHARGNEIMGEPYGELTDAPTQGSSRGGGQRFGTMETDAICAYGASAYMQELTNERCDNAIARNNFYVNTYLPGKLKKRYLIDSKGQRRAVTQFLYSMLAMGLMCEPEDGEFLPLSKNNGVELARWKPSVIQRATFNYDKDYHKNTEDLDEDHVENPMNDVTDLRSAILGDNK